MKVINFTSLKFRAYLLAAMVLLAFASVVFPQADSSEVPANTGFINDYANVIDADTKSALEKRLKDLRDGTDARIEIAVLTVSTTGGKDIFDYSLAVARGWKIGSKEQDNPSLLLVVAINDRKYFTQVSRDAEGDITDGLAGQIQRQYLVPAFKQGQYGKGINDTIDAYIRRLGEVRGFDPVTLQKTDGATAPPVTGKTGKGSSLFGCFICGGIIAFIIFIFVFSAVSRSKTRRSSWNGGGFGGSGGRKGDGGDSVWPWIIGGVIGSLGSGGSGDSGSSGGSDWGSGGGDWGGFGGGGDFGGGGAGGDW